MSAALVAGDGEVDRHVAACNASSSTEDVSAELARHADAMGSVMARMDAARQSMQSGGSMMHGGMMARRCSGAAFDSMCANLDAVHVTMSDYVTDMHDAQSVDSEHALCEAHANDLRSMFDTMHAELGTLSCAMP